MVSPKCEICGQLICSHEPEIENIEVDDSVFREISAVLDQTQAKSITKQEAIAYYEVRKKQIEREQGILEMLRISIDYYDYG